MSPLRFRLAALALIVAVAVLRVVYLAHFCELDLSSDEAHYWDWSRRLDWCYYSKGPLVAWLIRLSCSWFGDTMLAVRLPAVACGAGLLVGLYVLTVQVHGSDRLAFAVVVLTQSLPILAVGSVLMTIDAPFTCAWMWALVFAYHASFSRQRWPWVAAGVCILVGVLAKHTMVLFVPSLLLFLATTPAMRDQSRRSGCWLMTGIGALGGVPILWWNARHGWGTFTHTLEHAGWQDDVAIHWLGPGRYLAGQFAILLGFWLIVWLRTTWRHRPTAEANPSLRFLWWMSVPTVAFFALFSWKNGGGGANWPIAGYLSGIVLVAGTLPSELRDARLGRVGLAMTTCVGLLLIVYAHFPCETQPILLALQSGRTQLPGRRLDPTIRLRGWRHLAAEVDRIRNELAMNGTEPVLASERWSQTGPLAFYCADQPTVQTLGMYFNDRPSQCELWRPNPVLDPQAFEGQTFVVVNMKAEQLRDLFTSVEPTRMVEYHEAGSLVATWPITIAHGFTPSRHRPRRATAGPSAAPGR